MTVEKMSVIPVLRLGEFIKYNQVYRNVRGRILSPTPKKFVGEMTDRKFLNISKRMNTWLIMEGKIEVGIRNRPWPLADDDYDDAVHFLFDPAWAGIQWPPSFLHQLC